MAIHTRDFEEGDRTECARLLNELPEWFGIAEANAAYIDVLGTIPTAVALRKGQLLGFVALEQHNSRSVEIHVLAVNREYHNQGVGSALIAWSESRCSNMNVPWLHVKTRGPSTPDPDYARTRSFYRAKGFDPLFESLTHWGPEDAALILVKKLSA
ncbi:MAG: GNAT family N-acetyltransferase [Gammaproteobacteria bacterium]|nr:GNAT family N-acetyltransferase [Gammaproteobacteria bacterium]